MKKLLCAIVVFYLSTYVYAQDVSLYNQFNGKYDFTFVGNTMNIGENNNNTDSVTTTSSSATLALSAQDTVVKAYLYWAGSGNGDFQINLNGTALTPDRTFSHQRVFSANTFTYFCAFKDITNFVQTTGNGTYTLSDLDISEFEPLHLTRKTNFAGWAILIIYENENLPQNQINVYDGLQGVPDALTINLTNLFVVDNNDAAAGFIAWEGDLGLATETFTVNDNTLSNALNPADNVFNGTNSVTGATNLYNMDLDIYSIEDYISVGDENATISLSSSQDFIMISTVVTKLNSQLPDATISIDATHLICDSQAINLDYTIYNVNSTHYLPSNTPISFYANDVYLATVYTTQNLAVGAQQNGVITLTIPPEIPQSFTLIAIADHNALGNGTVAELIENNNSFSTTISLWTSPLYNNLPNIETCNFGNNTIVFDFSAYENIVKTNASQEVSFYNSYANAVLETNPITNTSAYQSATQEEIFVRIENENCFSITSFLLIVKNCTITIYNAISANGDGINDVFYIDGLEDVYTNFLLEIYNRWGKLLWTGNNQSKNWDGYVKNGLGQEKVPCGTYYYVLDLNNAHYPKPITGYLYITD